MPIDPYYTAPRAEPLQLQAGETKLNYHVGFPIFAISINNYTEFFAFVEPSNRPGFWVSPYQIGLIANLYPGCDSVSITQQIKGPNGFSGAISIGGVGTIDIQVFDAPLSPQAGIISSPPIPFQITVIADDIIANFATSITVLTPPAGFNAIITALTATPVSQYANSMFLERVDVFWEELPPPTAPAQQFNWFQSISTETPDVTDHFELASAIIHDGSTLQFFGGLESFAFYTNAGLHCNIIAQVQYYLVLA